ncbi:xylose isomerase [Rhizobium sp. BK538]|nr:xylose isomerase [Rhizobium sp. BK060]MBB4167071.1 xylose isomerase [Rhizobium sp. BK538]TCM77857.1 hypothetical protein EV291_10623 [Rhizobium sp. BK068]
MTNPGMAGSALCSGLSSSTTTAMQAAGWRVPRIFGSIDMNRNDYQSG